MNSAIPSLPNLSAYLTASRLPTMPGGGDGGLRARKKGGKEGQIEKRATKHFGPKHVPVSCLLVAGRVHHQLIQV